MSYPKNKKTLVVDSTVEPVRCLTDQDGSAGPQQHGTYYIDGNGQHYFIAEGLLVDFGPNTVDANKADNHNFKPGQEIPDHLARKNRGIYWCDGNDHYSFITSQIPLALMNLVERRYQHAQDWHEYANDSANWPNITCPIIPYTFPSATEKPEVNAATDIAVAQENTMTKEPDRLTN
ncbi:hypothetical protein BDV96DRAFT_584832 [Lophiotrema nucula]|uniref:Uncharacterized protein n=1 Tax=Lophiotrema nucula TaxID=690887 RepID=A0A6A5YS29_9PLEO|nr:hypothetical protein BDV96DRAFT_584832 [Lophiotrema nucula]